MNGIFTFEIKLGFEVGWTAELHTSKKSVRQMNSLIKLNIRPFWFASPVFFFRKTINIVNSAKVEF